MGEFQQMNFYVRFELRMHDDTCALCRKEKETIMYLFWDFKPLKFSGKLLTLGSIATKYQTG